VVFVGWPHGVCLVVVGWGGGSRSHQAQPKVLMATLAEDAASQHADCNHDAVSQRCACYECWVALLTGSGSVTAVPMRTLVTNCLALSWPKGAAPCRQ
jgi:hypothetical protein